MIAGLANSSWAKNARAAGGGQLTKGRTHDDINSIEVTDPAIRQQVMTAFPTKVPHGVQFFIRIGIVPSADPADFAAASDKVTVSEIRPADAHTHLPEPEN